MKFWEIFRFEIEHQSRRAWTWLCFATVIIFSYQMASETAAANIRNGYLSNGPWVIFTATVFGSLIGLMAATALPGDAAARDVQSRIDPLLYTAPVRKLTYLAGRFFAAFVVNASILATIPIIRLVFEFLPRVEGELIGPFRLSAYLASYFLIALPNAFIVTAILFSMAVLSRRSMISYLGSLVLFAISILSWQLVGEHFGWWWLGRLTDPFGFTAFAELSQVWTPAQKNKLLAGTQMPLLINRAVWVLVALSVLALTHYRFRFAHHTARVWPKRREAVETQQSPRHTTPPRVQRTFGIASHMRQVLAVAHESFQEIVLGWGGRGLLALGILMALTTPETMEHLGIPMFPTTAKLVPYLAAPLTDHGEILWMILPLLIIYYAAELVWRERDARLNEMADTTPIPDWVPFAGKFLGIALVLVAVQVLTIGEGILVQAMSGFYDFQFSVYARVFLGVQLTDYLLFAALGLTVHTLVNQKYVGHMVMLFIYVFMVFGGELGLRHNLLIFGSDPGWKYSDIRGFDPFLAPWLWFKLYWASWALFLSVAAKALWARGNESGWVERLRLARRRLTYGAVVAGAMALVAILSVGGFVFYNTNVLNAYTTDAESESRRAEYERRYGRYKGIPQPELTGTKLRLEIYPERHEAEIRGTYQLVNRSGAAIDSVHVVTIREIDTSITFDRPAQLVLADEDFGHSIYKLEKALEPGESIALNFDVRFKPRGFSNEGPAASVVTNGTFFTNEVWLPAIGYQSRRELQNPGERRAHGLPERPQFRRLDDPQARHDRRGRERITFDAIVGTALGQIAAAPGELRREWSENGRRYFHYVTDAPIRNEYAFFSAAYAVHKTKWNDVAIEVFHHPTHTWNLDSMARSLQASLDYLTKNLGPYPYRQIRLVEHPGDGVSLHAFPINISFQEGFSLLNSKAHRRDVDFPFAVVAHEVAHQWWGNLVTPASVEGAALLTESLAWFSAMSVVEDAYGKEHLRRLLSMMSEAYLNPRSRAGEPLLRSTDRFVAYRKGPFAMYALREYLGGDVVNGVLRRVVSKYGSGEPPFATSLDLYAELQSVAPDSLRPLLADLFETNTYWELSTENVTAEPKPDGAWQVTLDVRARKVIVDLAGVEKELPMDDLIELGVFAEGNDALYIQKHRIHSGRQRFTVTVSGKPARGGIDPYNLLIDVEPDDNVKDPN